MKTVALTLTPAQLVDLDAIVVGSLARYHQELCKEPTDRDPARTAFYLDWIKRAEALKALVRPLLPAVPEGSPEPDDDDAPDDAS